MLPSATLAEFYRFAWLLTAGGERAERVMADTLAECETRLGDLRDVTHRAAWLATRIRQRCMENQPGLPPAPRLLREASPDGTPEVLPIEAYIVAGHFQALPEPERSALALFYLDLFSAAQISELLEMDLERLALILERARALLQRSLRPESAPYVPPAVPPSSAPEVPSQDSSQVPPQVPPQNSPPVE